LPKKLALGKWAEHIAKIAGQATENLTALKDRPGPKPGKSAPSVIEADQNARTTFSVQPLANLAPQQLGQNC
jgi:hypothetical protein